MSVRDELAEMLALLRSRRHGRGPNPTPYDKAVGTEQADAVLAFFGINPDADPELIAAHLRADRKRAEWRRLSEGWPNPGQWVDLWCAQYRGRAQVEMSGAGRHLYVRGNHLYDAMPCHGWWWTPAAVPEPPKEDRS